MTWWQDALYGPVVAHDPPNAGLAMRSRALEFEEVQQIARLVDDLLDELEFQDRLEVTGGMPIPAQPEPSVFETDEGDIPRDAELRAVSALALRTLRIRQREAGVNIFMQAGSVPRVLLEFGGSLEMTQRVADMVQSRGRPRVWWQRWPAAVPYLLLCAAAVAGVVALRTSDLSVAWWFLLVFVGVLLVPGVHSTAEDLRARSADAAPGMRIYDQPRAELRASRANRRADLRVGLVVGAVVSVPAAVLGAVLQAKLGG